MEVHGPYWDKRDGRLIVRIYDSLTDKQTTKTYARYLMEEHLGRELTKEETVDHINENPTDNRIENLQILTRSENSKKSNRLKPRNRRPITWYYFICPECEKEARTPRYDYEERQVTKGMSGPYCSKSCATRAQMQKRQKKAKEIKPTPAQMSFDFSFSINLKFNL